MTDTELNDTQLLRYSRQIMLPQVDVAGQTRILNSRVLIVGLGGLGCPAALYLAAAGVGTLQLVDFDRVDVTNLQRQISHTDERVGWLKVASAAVSIKALNPEVTVIQTPIKLEGNALKEAFSAADVVLDCTDNLAVRHRINHHCIDTTTPLVSGAAIRMEGQVSVFDPRQPEAPCYHCLYGTDHDEDLTCSHNGVLAPMVGIVGAVQALEALKLITHVGQPLVGRLLFLDGLSMEWRCLKLKRDEACPVCSRRTE